MDETTKIDSRSSFYDRAARYSFIASFATIPVAYLILSLMLYGFGRVSPMSLEFGHLLSSASGGLEAGIVYFAFFIQFVSFVLGVVSLFGTRRRRLSFWMALFGSLASGAIVFVILAVLVCFVGRKNENARDAVSKYHMVQLVSTVPKAVSDDVQSYIRSKNLPASDISWIEYMEDGAGGHAVVITQELPKSRGQDLNSHVLFYDKNNLRTKVRVYPGHRSS